MMFFISTLFILAPLTAQETETPVFKAGVSDVRVDVQVTEGKNLVNGLSKDDFIVTDENQPQSIVHFSHGEERLNIILLLDISGSMQKYIDEIAQTARESLEHLRPGDRVAIMVFARTSAVHQGFSDNLAETARQIASAVKVDVGTSTLINSAVMDAARYMEANAGSDGRRAILILTDNLSMSYQLTDGQVIRELNKADTVFNAIVTGRAIRPRPLDPGKPGNPDFTPANVFHLSEETGGEWVKAEQAGVSFNEMIGHIRSRYSLAYHEPPSEPGMFRHIGVALTETARRRFPLAELKARNGYYAE
ncbi:MAG TPA: VWA domain-containing protein [Bryobacteraceae bacterium]|jgi:VWFA-related protein|nr:VWA domain-containing protein [Bryobacteraceae bacterium]